MGEWARASIGDFFDLDPGYAFKSADFIGEGVPVIKIKNIKAGHFSEHEFSYVSPRFLDAKADKLAKPGDLLISMSGNRHDGSPETWVGKIALFKKDGKFFINQRVGALRRKPNANIDTRFAGFLLASLPYQELFISIATSSGGQANLSPQQILSAELLYPSLETQSAIGEILGALSDKIDLNRRMNETLEVMARVIFKDWFVDFGPTRAKAENRGSYITPEIWALFPNRLDEVGKPEGWITSTIGQEVEVAGGSTPSTKEPEYWGGDIAWATPKDLSSLSAPVLLSTERQITKAGLSQIGSGLLPVGTVLLSSRAPIGYMAIAQIPTAVNQGFIAMVCRKRLSNVFVWLWTQASMETVLQNANGSTFQEISKANFRPISVTFAPPDLLRAFEESVRPLFDRIVSNDKENRTLAQTRDFLLPKLMSGKIRVKGADKIAEALL
jgi:type I restriction enzyme S subunit